MGRGNNTRCNIVSLSNYYCQSLLQREISRLLIVIKRNFHRSCLICCYLSEWAWSLALFCALEIKPLCCPPSSSRSSSFRAVCEANDWKKVSNSGANFILASGKTEIYFYSFLLSLAFQLTKIVILLRNHIYVRVFVAVKLAIADFEQFIYFAVRCACFSRVFPSSCLFLCPLWCAPLRQLMCWGTTKAKGNSTTISWLFGNQLRVAVTFLVLLSYMRENTLKNFSHFF